MLSGGMAYLALTDDIICRFGKLSVRDALMTSGMIELEIEHHPDAPIPWSYSSRTLITTVRVLFQGTAAIITPAPAAYDAPVTTNGMLPAAVVRQLRLALVTTAPSTGDVTASFLPLDEAVNAMVAHYGAMMCEPGGFGMRAPYGTAPISRSDVLMEADLLFPLSEDGDDLGDVMSRAAASLHPSIATPTQIAALVPLVCRITGDEIDSDQAMVRVRPCCAACRELASATTKDRCCAYSVDGIVGHFAADAGMRWDADGKVYGRLPLNSRLWLRMLFAEPYGCLGAGCIDRAFNTSSVLADITHGSYALGHARHHDMLDRISDIEEMASSLVSAGRSAGQGGVVAAGEYLLLCGHISRHMFGGGGGRSAFSCPSINPADDLRTILRQLTTAYTRRPAFGFDTELDVEAMRQAVASLPRITLSTFQSTLSLPLGVLQERASFPAFWAVAAERLLPSKAQRGQHRAAEIAHRFFCMLTDALVPCCPGCMSAISLEAGCTHITCDVCGTHSCFCCGKPHLHGRAPVHPGQLRLELSGVGVKEATLAELAFGFALPPALRQFMVDVDVAMEDRDISTGERVGEAMRLLPTIQLGVSQDVFAHSVSNDDDTFGCPTFVADFKDRCNTYAPVTSLMNWRDRTDVRDAMRTFFETRDDGRAFQTITRVAHMMAYFMWRHSLPSSSDAIADGIGLVLRLVKGATGGGEEEERERGGGALAFLRAVYAIHNSFLPIFSTVAFVCRRPYPAPDIVSAEGLVNAALLRQIRPRLESATTVALTLHDAPTTPHGPPGGFAATVVIDDDDEDTEIPQDYEDML